MISDKRTTFAEDVTLATATGTANLGDIIDLENSIDAGAGHPVYICFKVDTAVTSAGSATVAFQVVSDATSTIATNGSATFHGSTGAIGKNDLTAGAQFAITLPPGMSIGYERFLAVQSVVGTAALTAGAVSAFLTFDPPSDYRALPDATN